MADERHCIYVDDLGTQCWDRKSEPPYGDPVNADYCREHRPSHPYDRDPACWSWSIPERPGDDDPWTVLADWQDDRCGICGRRGAGSVLDHDHQSGLVRGWICHTCNVQEGRGRRPLSRSARWRACPATAMLDLLMAYGQSRGLFDGEIETWTGKTYLPASAPAAHRWPHALTCDIGPVLTTAGVLVYRCDHPHRQLVLDVLREPMSDGVAPPLIGTADGALLDLGAATLGAGRPAPP